MDSFEELCKTLAERIDRSETRERGRTLYRSCRASLAEAEDVIQRTTSAIGGSITTGSAQDLENRLYPRLPQILQRSQMQCELCQRGVKQMDDCVIHSFRHCLRDRLRAIECPADINMAKDTDLPSRMSG